MAEVPIQPKPTSQGINWKNIFIGAIIGALLVGVGVLIFYLYQGSSEEFIPTTTPDTSTPSAKISTPSSKSTELKEVNLNQEFSLNEGEEVMVSGTDLKIKTTDIDTPAKDTFDSPNRVTLKLSHKGSVEEITLIIGGNQPLELAEQRRQKDIFGFNIYVVKVDSSEVTFIVKAK